MAEVGDSSASTNSHGKKLLRFEVVGGVLMDAKSVEARPKNRGFEELLNAKSEKDSLDTPVVSGNGKVRETDGGPKKGKLRWPWKAG